MAQHSARRMRAELKKPRAVAGLVDLMMRCQRAAFAGGDRAGFSGGLVDEARRPRCGGNAGLMVLRRLPAEQFGYRIESPPQGAFPRERASSPTRRYHWQLY